MKICLVGAELFHAHRRTDMTLTVAFRNFANVPKRCFHIVFWSSDCQYNTRIEHAVETWCHTLLTPLFLLEQSTPVCL
jgi:hypothetical protein